MARFFIDRPVLAMVIAIVIVLLGIVAIPNLPIANYPEVVPPVVQISTSYLGGNAGDLERTVTQPIEEQLVGLDGLLYFLCNSSNDGTLNIQVTFKLGTNPDVAVVQTQNRVSIAMPRLPQEVQRQGVTVKKVSSALLTSVGIISRDNRYDPIMKFHYQIMLFITGVLFGVNAGNAADDSLEGNFFPDKAGAWEYKLLGYDVLQYHGKDLRCKLGPDKPFCDKVQLIYDITRANPVFNPPLGFQARAITNWISTAPLSAADNGKEALPVLEYGVSIRPKNALLRLNLANSYMDAGSDAKAKAILDTLAFEYPNDRPATGGKHYEGKKYAISYSRKDNAAPISMLQIVRNYEAAIAKIGGKHLGGDGRRIAAEIQKGGSVTGVYVEAYSPIASNKEEDGRAQNRRVEMVEQ